MNFRPDPKVIALLCLALAIATTAYSSFTAGGSVFALSISAGFLIIAIFAAMLNEGLTLRVGEMVGGKRSADETSFAQTFRLSAFEGSSVAMMTVDRDFNIIGVNASTQQLLRENEQGFKQIWPSFDASNIVGMNIDMFHKNPAHQRRLLSDPSMLPYKTDITVGDLKFALNVSGVFDAEGAYIGNVLEWDDVTDARQNAGALNALDSIMATIEFDLDGTILNANKNFLDTVGYTLPEIVGQHHSMFMQPEESKSADYKRFWESLGRGEHRAGKFQRVGKLGKEIWIDGTYFPITDANGTPFKVMKFATDITEREANRVLRKQERQKHEQDLSVVIDNLASGLKHVASGDFSSLINEPFAPSYERIRSDFNDAVGQLQAAEIKRLASQQEQTHVVEQLALGLKRLSDGNLIQTIDEEFASDYEQLRLDFNIALETLRNVMSEITSTSQDIRSGSNEISDAADKLSKRTEHQAATLQETVAALTQITSAVQQTANNAKEASQAATDSGSEAKAGGEIILRAVDAMEEIEKSSNQISQISGLIEDIAFQTNLLALNAGVEAARAGESGRGFSVVAKEVRALAQRSADSAKAIKELISAGAENVESGVKLVGDAGTALSKIVASVENVGGLVLGIAASAEEQSTCLLELNGSANTMDHMTQQNAAMVEQTTSASHALAGEANALMGQVSRFEIGSVPTSEDEKLRHKSGNGRFEEHEESILAQKQRAQAFARSTRGATAMKLENADSDWENF